MNLFSYYLYLGGGLVLWLGVLRVTSGRMTLGVLLVVLSYLASLFGPIRSLTRLASVLARGAASRERLSELLTSDEYVSDAPDAVPAPASPCSQPSGGERVVEPVPSYATSLPA